ncbi:MAG TPA: serine hydrolase domain-containing protein [Rhizomicrobium sp.]|nr:serine hydrolase domain-containing protein [Rhizomicrobium sp.]
MAVTRGTIGILFFLITAGAAANAQPIETPPPAATKIDRNVNEAMHRFRVPGAAVMVIRDGRVTYARAFGFRDLQHRLPVRTDTLFEIGSITKQFTAACIMQLQEKRKLQVDRPLSDYLPDAPHAREVTLRQLLTHTSGLHDYLDGPPVEVSRLAARPIAYRDLIARVGKLPLDFTPGSKWSYSNTGYLLLGKVIEKVSGESYRDYLENHILRPLHMTDTYTTADEDRLPRMAIGYWHVNGKLERAPVIDPSWGYSAGFLVSTLSDLAKWDAALRGGKVVSSASYREMTTPFVTGKNGSADYGFGLFIDSVYGQPRIGHTGGSQGFTTADEYFPRQGVRIVAFTNLGDSTPEPGEALTNVVFGDLYPAIAANALRPAPNENALVTRTVREAFRELQMGKDYARFGARLKSKLAGGVGSKFVTAFGPYGAPTREIFIGIRRDAKDTWYDYKMQFGPGTLLPFAVKLDQDGTVSSFSIG